MRRAVFDSTVLISAFLSRRGGLSHELLGLARKGEFQLILSTEILLEVLRKLVESDEIKAKYRYSDDRAHRYCRGLNRIVAETLRSTQVVSGVVRDLADDMVLACALDGKADTIVMRDKDLLSLGNVRGVAIITPEVFRGQLRDAL